MARLQKRELLAQVEEAIRISGLNVLYLTAGLHPALYRIYDGQRDYIVKAASKSPVWHNSIPSLTLAI
jgi:hypothetical protein